MKRAKLRLLRFFTWISSSDSKKVSRIEWLCAAMIDFIPIIIMYSFCHLFTGILFYDYEFYFSKELYFRDITFVPTILLAVYMLLKDFLFDGRSIGKRFVNIRIVRPENFGKFRLILRNLPIFLVTLIVLFSNTIIDFLPYKLSHVFPLYMWADFICFATKGKTIGDCLAHTNLEVSEDPSFLLQKNVSKRIACFVVVLILFRFEGFYVSPGELARLLDLSYTQYQYLYILFQFVAYVYIFYKLIEYRHLRGMVVALFSAFLCCYTYWIWSQNINVLWIITLLCIVIIAVLLYITKNRRLGNPQIRTDLENRFWGGCDLQKGKNYVTIVAMVLIMSILHYFAPCPFCPPGDGCNTLNKTILLALYPILFVMLPVVYLSKKYINQVVLRWIIYISSLLNLILQYIPDSSYLMRLIFQF